MSSEKWAGFTDEDIVRINKSTRSDCDSCNDRACDVDGTASKKRGPMKIKKLPIKSNVGEYLDGDNVLHSDSIANEFMSSYPDVNIQLNNSETNCTCDDYICCDNQEKLATVNNETGMSEQKCKDLDESNAHLLPLEGFELRQKRIETENARRRALINKAITDKKMRTQAEAIKLAHITQELSRIDSSLSADVSILRDYIEKASLEFSEAEKRYLKAEKEFVESKLILFEKMQRKEMLTEHLCAIIEQNENRKADKLVELMKKLEMEVLLDECQMNGIQPILPSLCALNDEAYQTCQTIKPTLSKGSSQNSVNSLSEKLEKTEQAGVSSANSNESISGASSEKSLEVCREKSNESTSGIYIEKSSGVSSEKSEGNSLNAIENSVVDKAEEESVGNVC